MDLICQIIKQGKEETETFWDKAVQDSNEAGGNDIYTYGWKGRPWSLPVDKTGRKWEAWFDRIARKINTSLDSSIFGVWYHNQLNRRQNERYIADIGIRGLK